MPSIFEKLGKSLANIRDSYHFSVPSRAIQENNLTELAAWLESKEPSYEEVEILLYSTPSVNSAATIGRHLLKHHTQDYRKLLDATIDHRLDVEQRRQPGSPTDLTATRSGTVLLGLLQGMEGLDSKPQRGLGQPESLLSFEQELKLMQLTDTRAYIAASKYSPPVTHFVDYRPLLELDAQSFERFCRIGAPRHSGVDLSKLGNNELKPEAGSSNFRSILLNTFADHLTTSPKPRYDLAEVALNQNLFNVGELIFAVSVHSPQHLGRPAASFNSSTEAIGARLEAKNQVIERFATVDLCLKEAGKLTFTESLDQAYQKKLNTYYQADPNIAGMWRRQPEDLVKHLDGKQAELADITSLTSPAAQYVRTLTALKTPNTESFNKDKFCIEVLHSMEVGGPLEGLVAHYGHTLWEKLSAQLSPEYQESATRQDKNWRLHLAENMGNSQVTLNAARSISRTSISEHYELMRELIENDKVQLVAELCDRSPNKPQSRMNATESMLLGDLAHTAHRAPLLDKIISTEMLSTVLPDNNPGQAQQQEKVKLVERIAASTLPDKILGNTESSIPDTAKVTMLGVLLSKTGADIGQPSLESLLTGNSPTKSQMLVQLVKHGSFGTRKNLLFAAAQCPDEELQETIVDELLTRPLSLEENELDKFDHVSPRTREMLEKAVEAEQLTLPRNSRISFGTDSPSLE